MGIIVKYDSNSFLSKRDQDFLTATFYNEFVWFFSIFGLEDHNTYLTDKVKQNHVDILPQCFIYAVTLVLLSCETLN